MITTRPKRFVVVKQCPCEVRYYVLARPIIDPHFRTEPCYIVSNKYFDTKEEAENFKKELDAEETWVEYSVEEEFVKWLE